MFSPGIFLPPVTFAQLTFYRSGATFIDGQESPGWSPVVTVNADIQPSAQRKVPLDFIEAYETVYNVKVPRWTELDLDPDIQSKDRTVVFGQVAEVISVNVWGSHLNVLVATFRNVDPSVITG